VRVAVLGPGAVGGGVAASLAQDPRLEVEVWARTPFESLVVETPDGTLTARPRVVIDPRHASRPDWLLLATKAYDVDGAAPWLTQLDTRCRVAVLQNGVEHVERLAPYLDPARVVPVVVDCPAERRAPGQIRLRRHGGLVVPEGPSGDDLVALFRGTRIAVTTTPDLRTAAWQKLCFNAAGAVCAVTLQTAGVAARDDVADLMRALVRECVEVGRAEGADLDAALPDRVVAGHRSAAPDAVNSMLADRLAGRRMEVDARNGVIVRRGRVHRIATPANAMIVTLLDASSTSIAPAPSRW
jgi:2-dehydropantoate 2-reductase